MTITVISIAKLFTTPSWQLENHRPPLYCTPLNIIESPPLLISLYILNPCGALHHATERICTQMKKTKENKVSPLEI